MLIIMAMLDPRERHLETLLHYTLRSIILVRQIPRTLVQLTLQVRSLPEEDTPRGINNVRSYHPQPFTTIAPTNDCERRR